MDASKNQPTDRSSTPNSAPKHHNLEMPGANTIRFFKGRHSWTFRYTIGCEIELINLLESYAQDDDCDLDWFDIAILCRQIELWLERCLKHCSGDSEGDDEDDCEIDIPANNEQFSKSRITNNSINRLHETDK